MTDTNPTTRVERIRQRLLETFAPQELEIEDQSHLHVGHAGARDGRGHFRVVIRADAFSGLGPVARHRRIYDALDELMRSDIHALSIRALAPEDDN